jgi:hypothetical protein
MGNLESAEDCSSSGHDRRAPAYCAWTPANKADILGAIALPACLLVLVLVVVLVLERESHAEIEDEDDDEDEDDSRSLSMPARSRVDSLYPAP